MLHQGTHYKRATATHCWLVFANFLCNQWKQWNCSHCSGSAGGLKEPENRSEGPLQTSTVLPEREIPDMMRTKCFHPRVFIWTIKCTAEHPLLPSAPPLHRLAVGCLRRRSLAPCFGVFNLLAEELD